MSKTKKILCALCSIIPCSALAKSGSVNYSWGADALATMHDYVVTMMFYVQALCCAIAGICVIVSGFQIYVKMNTGEDGITKSSSFLPFSAIAYRNGRQESSAAITIRKNCNTYPKINNHVSKNKKTNEKNVFC